RELGKLLGYAKWQHFAEVIEEAQEVCRINGGKEAVTRSLPLSVKIHRVSPSADAKGLTITSRATPAT
ncbi:MAG TPA: hypothetical protein VFY89_10430, partial [Ktedonobacterales bacterium]